MEALSVAFMSEERQRSCFQPIDAEATVGNGNLRGRISLRWSVAVECLKAAKAKSKGNGWDRIISGARIQLGRENCENADILIVCREAVSVILFAR